MELAQGFIGLPGGLSSLRHLAVVTFDYRHGAGHQRQRGLPLLWKAPLCNFRCETIGPRT